VVDQETVDVTGERKNCLHQFRPGLTIQAQVNMNLVGGIGLGNQRFHRQPELCNVIGMIDTQQHGDTRKQIRHIFRRYILHALFNFFQIFFRYF
jgi:hypothetical protein